MDLHRYPYSLLSETKGINVTRVGDVTDKMDKTIGRPVVCIKGAVSAKNYIDFNGLHLIGRYIYIQVELLTQVATLHIELINSSRNQTLF
jgi:hypothetical protein